MKAGCVEVIVDRHLDSCVTRLRAVRALARLTRAHMGNQAELHRVRGLETLLGLVRQFNESADDELVATYALQTVCFSVVDSEERKLTATENGAVTVAADISSFGSNEYLKRSASTLLACCTDTKGQDEFASGLSVSAVSTQTFGPGLYYQQALEE